MRRSNSTPAGTLLTLSLLLPLWACSDDAASDDFGEDSLSSGGESGGWEEGGDGDSFSTSAGDGDGDPGDGDGDSGADSGDTGGEEPEPPDESDESESESESGDPVCDDQTPVVLYLSPDDSNSMSSPVHVRERVLNENSQSLGGIPVRVWEFMNYYGFDYPAAADGELALYAAMAPVEGQEATYRLQLAVSSETMTPDERPPMNITLVLDTSGSMAGEPMEMLKESCRAIAAHLRAGDVVSMVEWDTENVWTLAGYEVTGPNDALLLDKIEELTHGGGTDLNGGLVSGYDLAQQAYDVDMLNRLVLISDGGANAGITDVEIIAANAVYGGSDGIYLVGVGVADGSSYNSELIDVVTDAGKGASVFVTDMAEAWKIFDTEFESTMAIAGREVQVELEMPPGFEIVKFSGEEFSGDPHEIEPQHIAPNDAMVFHQQIMTCAPELITDSSPITVTATWDDPWSFEAKEIQQTWTFGELAAMDQTMLLKGAAVLAYAESLKIYKQADTDEQKSAALASAFAALTPAQMALPADEDLLEIAMILAALNP